MAHAAMPGFVGIQLQHIMGDWKTIFKDGGPLVGRQAQGNLPGLGSRGRIHQHVAIAPFTGRGTHTVFHRLLCRQAGSQENTQQGCQ